MAKIIINPITQKFPKKARPVPALRRNLPVSKYKRMMGDRNPFTSAANSDLEFTKIKIGMGFITNTMTRPQCVTIYNSLGVKAVIALEKQTIFLLKRKRVKLRQSNQG